MRLTNMTYELVWDFLHNNFNATKNWSVNAPYPEVNDYVAWNTPMGLVHKWWVYFKCEDYITIEIGVKPKPHCEYATNDNIACIG